MKPLHTLFLFPALLWAFTPALHAQEETDLTENETEFAEEGETDDEAEEELSIDTDGAKFDSAVATQQYEAEAEAGNAEAQRAFGLGYHNGLLQGPTWVHPLPVDLEKSLYWNRRAGEQGVGAASAAVGTAYKKGYGTEVDIDQAVAWWERALQQGYSWAGWQLSLLFLKGEEVEEDWERSFACLQRAAEATLNEELPDDDIIATLGVYYDKGIGTEPSRDKALPLFKQAAEMGNARAIFMLGQYTAEGLAGLQQDAEQAYELYRRAAIKGDAEAQCNLGTAFATGTGVAKDMNSAVVWFRAAALKGNATAMVNLAKCCLHGLGTDPDPAQAEAWLKQAAARGNKDAAEMLK